MTALPALRELLAALRACREKSYTAQDHVLVHWLAGREFPDWWDDLDEAKRLHAALVAAEKEVQRDG